MMRTSRVLHVVGLVVAAAGLPEVAAQPADATAYTVVLQEVLTARNGTSSVVAVETRARRDDGATALQLGGGGATARHIRLPSGLLIETNDRTKRKSTFHIAPGLPAGAAREPAAKCRRDDERVDGEEHIGGYRAAKIVRPRGGTVVWYALDYACAPVRAVMEHADGSRSEKLLVSLSGGPPAEALFQAGDYLEGPPSALEEVVACDASCEQRRKRRDAEYHRLRRR